MSGPSNVTGGSRPSVLSSVLPEKKENGFIAFLRKCNVSSLFEKAPERPSKTLQGPEKVVEEQEFVDALETPPENSTHDETNSANSGKPPEAEQGNVLGSIGKGITTAFDVTWSIGLGVVNVGFAVGEMTYEIGKALNQGSDSPESEGESSNENLGEIEKPSEAGSVKPLEEILEAGPSTSTVKTLEKSEARLQEVAKIVKELAEATNVLPKSLNESKNWNGFVITKTKVKLEESTYRNEKMIWKNKQEKDVLFNDEEINIQLEGFHYNLKKA